MANQRQWRPSSPEHRLDESDLVPKVNHPVRRPVWALAGVIGIGSEDAEPWRKDIHQPAPLRRGARVRMNAYDSGAGSCLAKKRLDGLPRVRDAVLDHKLRHGSLLSDRIRSQGHVRTAIPQAVSVRATFVAAGCVTRIRGTNIGTLRRYSAYLSPWISTRSRSSSRIAIRM